MAVVDANSGKTLANPAIGDGPDAARYDAARKLAFSSNGGGTLTIIDAGKDSYPVLQNLATQRGARTMTLDSATGRIYLATATFGERPAPRRRTRVRGRRLSPAASPSWSSGRSESAPGVYASSYLMLRLSFIAFALSLT
jgi:hypothetical protein